jgi:hypothetical protein
MTRYQNMGTTARRCWNTIASQRKKWLAMLQTRLFGNVPTAVGSHQ